MGEAIPESTVYSGGVWNSSPCSRLFRASLAKSRKANREGIYTCAQNSQRCGQEGKRGHHCQKHNQYATHTDGAQKTDAEEDQAYQSDRDCEA